jgi:EAL domain-containing protein (putative c-di-GMP-specific phosphodiesterase class I)/CHASE2 domain-containing sensor protein
MRAVPWRKKDGRKEQSERSPVRLLIWTALIGLVIGFFGIGQLAEDQLRIARNRFHMHKASGDIVFVAIDDSSMKKVGRWPWARSTHAALVDKLSEAGARRIIFDVAFEVPSNAADDQMLAKAIERSGKVVLPVRGIPGKRNEQRLGGPLPLLRPHAQLGSIWLQYNYQNAVWSLPRAVSFEGALIPSLATKMAHQKPTSTAMFPLDYSVDPKTIPRVSASQVLDGTRSASVRGKDVIIGADSGLLGDLFFMPGVGQMAGAYVQMIGAETLKSGTPSSAGWLLPFAFAALLSAFAAFRKRWRTQAAVLALVVVVLLAGPIPLEAHLLFVDVVPGLFVTLSVWAVLLWVRYKNHEVTNSVSGLPNLTALKAFRKGSDQALIVARILNYAEIAASLPAEAERTLVEQIVGRLTVGSPAKATYHGDGGIFAWFEEARFPFGNHIDALHALFRNPIKVGDQAIDLSVAFGVEVGSGRSLANRLASALVAAEEAAHDGLKWMIHDPGKLTDASWKLSLLSRLDQAIDQGEVWVAYQPKLDLATRQVVGAEALARWTHPEKGPIAASEFVAAAEQHDRIGKLTDFVLEQAIRSAASINGMGDQFHVAVNLSARLLGDSSFVIRLSELLLKYRLEPQLLTLELTETSALGSGEALVMLSDLRNLGVEISIDDYGTGLSTLDYLKKVPASEIKIDQSFIKNMLENRGDRVMVQSTIALAHSLGRTVVAEGVEQREVLDALVEMKCDLAQGFVIGRPMGFDSLVRRLKIERKRSVA